MITEQEYLDIYDVVGAAMEVFNALGRGMSISSEHRAQLFNYMRVSKQDKGILLNYGEKKLRAERYIFDDETDGFTLLTKQNYMQYVIRNK